MINKKVLLVVMLPFAAAAIIFGINAQKNNAGSGQLDINQIQASTNQIKEINVVARQWNFEPAEITVNRGDKVRLNITSDDVPHGFAIREYNINKIISPGQTAAIEFTADQPGEFTFYCSVFCGQGHKDQTGKLIVK